MKIRCLGALALVTSGLAGCVPQRTDVALPGGAPRALAVGDVNGDGKDEIIVGHRPSPTATGELSGASLLTPEDGDTFQSRSIDLVDFEPDHLLLVDLDGDKKLDLVAVQEGKNAAGTVHVLLGHGDGTFSAVEPLVDVGNPLAIAAGDLDGDGKMDLVISSAPPGAPLLFYRGLGRGTFDRPERYFGVSPSRHLAVGDVNGDGKLEVVMGTADGNVDVLLHEGGKLLAPIRTKVGEGEVSVALGDVNGDGKPEIVAAPDHSPSISIVSGLGARFSAEAVPMPDSQTFVAVGDVDGDGKPEIVTADREESTLSLLAQDKKGHYERVLTVPAGERPAALTLANLHGDGQLDAITTNERGGSISVVHFLHRR